MIRIRVKPGHIMVRKVGEPKQRFTSAIHALHVVCVMRGSETIETTLETQEALSQMIAWARMELQAAIMDVL